MRIGAAIGFATAFVAGAAFIFWLVTATGEFLGLARLPWQWRVGVAAAILILLAASDVVGISKATYCPISWRRQTPRMLMRRYDLRAAALVWGFDTGLLVTTFRVAAIGWGALVLSALGFSRGWTGVGYGLGFTIPFLFLILRPKLGRASRSAVPEDPGLTSMLALRPMMQGASAILLIASSAFLLGA